MLSAKDIYHQHFGTHVPRPLTRPAVGMGSPSHTLYVCICVYIYVYVFICVCAFIAIFGYIENV